MERAADRRHRPGLPGRRLLTTSLAARLAEIGRLRDLGILHLRPDLPPISAVNSAHRVAALNNAWETPDLTDVQGPILLVDALTDTGWTFTMAARALRAAGADAILPFALATPS